ncbi:hypothetical protein TB1_006793 [Malus domestica]
MILMDLNEFCYACGLIGRQLRERCLYGGGLTGSVEAIWSRRLNNFLGGNGEASGGPQGEQVGGAGPCRVGDPDLCVELGGVEDRRVDMAGALLRIFEGVGSDQRTAQKASLGSTQMRKSLKDCKFATFFTNGAHFAE